MTRRLVKAVAVVCALGGLTSGNIGAVLYGVFLWCLSDWAWRDR